MEQMQEQKPVAVGDIFKNSWGYDMTINDYVRVLEVSPTGKTIKVVMLGKKVTNDDGLGSGRSVPTEPQGEPFRLHIRQFKNSGEFYLVGQYAFCSDAKTRGCFFRWDNKPDYYNTWD